MSQCERQVSLAHTTRTTHDETTILHQHRHVPSEQSRRYQRLERQLIHTLIILTWITQTQGNEFNGPTDKDRRLETCPCDTRDQQRFITLQVAADWHELMPMLTV